MRPRHADTSRHRQQWPKIKKDCAGLVGTIVDGDGTPAKSPAKRGGKKAAGEKSTGKRKSKKDEVEEEGVGREDDEESPSKAKKMKLEATEDSGDEV